MRDIQLPFIISSPVQNDGRGSEKIMIPISVATIGSIVANIPALLASTVRSPSVE